MPECNGNDNSIMYVQSAVCTFNFSHRRVMKILCCVLIQSYKILNHKSTARNHFTKQVVISFHKLS